MVRVQYFVKRLDEAGGNVGDRMRKGAVDVTSKACFSSSAAGRHKSVNVDKGAEWAISGCPYLITVAHSAINYIIATHVTSRNPGEDSGRRDIRLLLASSAESKARFAIARSPFLSKV